MYLYIKKSLIIDINRYTNHLGNKRKFQKNVLSLKIYYEIHIKVFYILRKEFYFDNNLFFLIYKINTFIIYFIPQFRSPLYLPFLF